MRRLAKQFELGGQHRDTHIRLGAREVRLKCLSLISSFRQSLKRFKPARQSLAGSGPILLISMVAGSGEGRANQRLSPKDHYCSASVELTFRSVLIQGRSRC